MRLKLFSNRRASHLLRSLGALLLVLFAATAKGRPDLGLPPVTPLSKHGDSPAAVALGKALFFERKLSVNNTLSCAMCHIPEQGFAQNELATSVGLEGRVVKRNAPTILNVGYLSSLFHDGREMSLETQVWSPLLSDREMGNHSIGYVLEKVATLEDYASEFEAVYGELNIQTLGSALAAYQRSLVAGNSAFDAWYFEKDQHALSESAQKGFTLFNRHGCASCHTINDSYALFTDEAFHNTGIGHERTMSPKNGTRVVRLSETIVIETEEEFEGEVFNDLGRYEITGDPADRWRYRTPSLRNVALTAPYMHDGSMGTLREVIDFYMQGGFDSPDMDPRMLPFTLDEEEISQLTAFLHSLTSREMDRLVREARHDESHQEWPRNE